MRYDHAGGIAPFHRTFFPPPTRSRVPAALRVRFRSWPGVLFFFLLTMSIFFSPFHMLSLSPRPTCLAAHVRRAIRRRVKR